MNTRKHIILGIHITDCIRNAGEVQRLFGEFGCNIKTRLGLHEVNESECSPRGVVLLEMFGEETRCLELAERLAKVEGVEVQRMVFDHPA